MNPTQIITNRQDLLLLITPTDVKTYCNIEANIQDTKIIPCIELSQDMKIEEVLGATLYGKLIDEWITAGKIPSNLPDSTTSADGIDYRELYAQLYKALVFWSGAEVIGAVGIKVSEQGVMWNKTEYSDNGEIELLRDAEHRAKKQAEFYQTKFICYVKETFANDQDVQDEQQIEGGFDCGLYFPTSNTKCTKC